jgi:hypothetical protein
MALFRWLVDQSIAFVGKFPGNFLRSFVD